MSVDPTDPEIFTADATDAEDLGVEVPEADAAEQRAPLVPEQDDPLSELNLGEADPADAVEQARVVGFDEDERV